MIENLNFKQFTCLYNLFCKVQISLTSRQVARRVVKCQDETTRKFRYRELKNNFWIRHSACNTALTDLMFFDQAVCAVEHDDPEGLVRNIQQVGLQ